LHQSGGHRRNENGPLRIGIKRGSETDNRGYTYGSFQEMYQKAVKIARFMSKIEIENREKDRVKEEFGPRGSNSQGNRNFRRFKHGMK